MNYDKNYNDSHKWLRTQYGKATHCENQKCPKTCNTFHWALIHGKPHAKNRANYKQLCVRCHFEYDGVIQALAQRKLKQVVAVKDGIEYRYQSILDAVRRTGVSKTAISNNLAGRSKTADGFTWNIA